MPSPIPFTMKRLSFVQKHSSFVAGLLIVLSFSVMLYPLISNYIFEHRADSLISTYDTASIQTDTSQRDAMRRRAQEYNASLAQHHVQLTDPFKVGTSTALSAEYPELLTVDGSSVMAYIEIPKIDVYLPIYHGTEVKTLENGVGHLEGSSLPIGGASSHCVLTGHTGLNRAKLFTDLTELKQGDLFFIHALGNSLAYEVDQILVVEPYDSSALQIEQGKDYVTLVTCTPYGVNSHRLLVRGTRTKYTPEAIQRAEVAQKAEGHSVWMKEYLSAVAIGVGLIAGVALGSILLKKWRG